jgi:hypothetical protein
MNMTAAKIEQPEVTEQAAAQPPLTGNKPSRERTVWRRIGSASMLVFVGSLLVAAFAAGWAHKVGDVASSALEVSAIAMALASVIALGQWVLKEFDIDRKITLEERFAAGVVGFIFVTVYAAMVLAALSIWMEIFVGLANEA